MHCCSVDNVPSCYQAVSTDCVNKINPGAVFYSALGATQSHLQRVQDLKMASSVGMTHDWAIIICRRLHICLFANINKEVLRINLIRLNLRQIRTLIWI